eukprot:COSAG01_NODE_8404_length_2795_cov_46.853116_1_plen_64_part_00
MRDQQPACDTLRRRAAWIHIISLREPDRQICGLILPLERVHLLRCVYGQQVIQSQVCFLLGLW